MVTIKRDVLDLYNKYKFSGEYYNFNFILHKCGHGSKLGQLLVFQCLLC